jgi:hypothetical protein
MSNHQYSRIFDLGGRAVQVACVDAGSLPSTWEITADGALVRGQATAQFVGGVGAANYTLEFYTKIVRGGTGWRVGSGHPPYGPYFVLTSEYPEGRTFANTNRTLLPPNTLVFNSGWSLQNQTGLETPANQYYPLDIAVEENKWYRVSTVIQEHGYQVKIDGKLAAFVPLLDPPSEVASQPQHPATKAHGASAGSKTRSPTLRTYLLQQETELGCTRTRSQATKRWPSTKLHRSITLYA